MDKDNEHLIKNWVARENQRVTAPEAWLLRYNPDRDADAVVYPISSLADQQLCYDVASLQGSAVVITIPSLTGCTWVEIGSQSRYRLGGTYYRAFDHEPTPLEQDTFVKDVDLRRWL